MRGFGLLRHGISTSVMVCNGLRWIRIKNIKSRRRQLTDARRRGRLKAMQGRGDAGKGSGYDSAHGAMGHGIN